jgi:hypothetical protein
MSAFQFISDDGTKIDLEQYEDTRSIRDRMLAQAAAAAKFPEPKRRWAVLGLMRQRFQPQTIGEAVQQAQDLAEGKETSASHCTEDEVFEAAYGDASGRDYWDAWLFEGRPVEELAKLLAAHCAASEHEFQAAFSELKEALGRQSHDTSGDSIRWLISNPNTSHLVPAGLIAFLRPETRAAPALPATHERPLENKPRNASPVSSISKTRPSPVKDRVKEGMAQMDNDALLKMLGKEMADHFCASRTICNEARSEVLSANVGRQKTSNDK